MSRWGVGTGLLAAVLAAAFLLPGCGGGGDKPDKAGFLKEASAICREAAAERTAALEKAASENRGRTLSRAEQVKVAAALFLPILQNMVGELRSLEVPEQGGKELEAAVKAFEKGLADAEANHADILSAQTFSPARKKAKAAGFPECSQF